MDITGRINRIDRLTNGQRECLALVYQHMTSKDIARALNISPHTVDMRLRTAIRTLGVSSRVEAARMLAATQPEGGYQPSVYQPSDIAPATDNMFDASNHSAGGYGDQIETRRVHFAGLDLERTGNDNPVHDNQSGTALNGSSSDVGAARGGQQHVSYRSAERAGLYRRGNMPALPFGVRRGERNDLSITARLTWIAVIAIAAALGFGGILAGIEALGRLI